MSQPDQGGRPGFDLETLYGLLPEVFRTRDAAIADGLVNLLTPAEQTRLQELRSRLSGGGPPLGEMDQRDLAALEDKRLRGPLKALLTIIADQVAGLEQNIEQLYDDQFIETCAEWAVPYIADLIGYRPFDPILQDTLGSIRAEVADTIRFRRRKGTAAVLQELAESITGWDAAVVEFFQRLAVTQYLNHLRLRTSSAGGDGAGEPAGDQPGTLDLRRADPLELIGTPFDPASRTADVRLIGGQRSRNASRPYPNIPNVGIFLWRTASRRHTDSPAFGVDARRFLFDPLGAPTQLFCAAERAAATASARLTVPVPLTRRFLRGHLASLYGPGKSLSIHVGNEPVVLEDVQVCDLSDIASDPDTSPWPAPAAGNARVAIDPVLGRIRFPADMTEAVRVTYHDAAMADLGGGEYDRQQRLGPPIAPERHVPADRPTLGQALGDLAGAGTVTLTGSDGHAGPTELLVAADGYLEVRAANGSRPLLRLATDLIIGGGDSGEVVLNGLLVPGGRLVVPALVNGQPNRLQRLRLVDCTLVPGRDLRRSGEPAAIATSLEIEAPHVSVEVDHCILGSVRVAEESRLAISHSILDGLAPHEVAYAAPGAAGAAGTAPGGGLTVDCCTVVGKLHTAVLTASNTILHARLAAGDAWVVPVRAARRQAGYARYSYLPLGGHVPPRFACVPRTASEARDVVPRFVSLRYGSAAYAQLHAGSPGAICTGADDRGEMGAFHEQYAPQHEAGLWTRLDEYLRFGLEAGVLFAT